MSLKVVNIYKNFKGKCIVNKISLKVNKGEIVGLLGPNGAGKSTTFYMIVGLIRPDKGSIFINSENITTFPMYMRARKGIGYLPQEPSIFRKLIIEDNIKAVLEMKGLSNSEVLKKTNILIKEFNLQKVRKIRADLVSGGERRRAEIARCIALNPKFILLDEPFAGVDPIGLEDIKNIILSLKMKNIGVLITDHNVQETFSINDRSYLIFEGAIIKHGNPKDLINDSLVRKVYLGNKFVLK